MLTSPRSRAAETARLAGFPDAVVDPNLGEWDYGEFEGRTTADIRAEVPDWSIWTGPWRKGETVDDVGRRADRSIERCLAPGVDGDVLLFAHGHLLRVLAARWIELPPDSGRRFALGTATIGILGWDRGARVIETWNEACHPRPAATQRRPGDRAPISAIARTRGRGPAGARPSGSRAHSWRPPRVPCPTSSLTAAAPGR